MWSDGLTGTLLYSTTLGDIPPGGCAIVQLGHASSGELWVKADPDYRIAESREENNLAVREVTVSFQLYLPLVIRNR